MFGQYERLANQFTGVMTGKGLAFGGSEIRKEATGYGTVDMMEGILSASVDNIEGKMAVVSGSGNVDQFQSSYLSKLINNLGLLECPKRVDFSR